MYTFVSSIVLPRTVGGQWTTTDVSDILVYQLQQAYSKVYIELSHPSLPNNIWVDLETLSATYSNYTGTVNEMLVILGDQTLVFTNKPPSTDVKYVKYGDAFRSFYKIELTNVGKTYPINYPNYSFRDLKLTRDKYKTDMSLIHKNCLVTVNGIIHPTDTDGTNAYVLEGAVTMHRSRDNHLGIMSFLDVGDLGIYSIDVENNVTTDVNQTLYNKLRFKIDADLSNKQVFLVLGGYLVFLQNSYFERLSDNTFSLNMKDLPILERIMESANYIDILKYLNLPSDTLTNKTNLEQLMSDELIKAYLSLPFTFLVSVGVDYLFTDTIQIKNNLIPGCFTAYDYEDVTYPLITGYGKVIEYWSTYEDGFYAVNVTDAYYRNYLFSAVNKNELTNITNQQLPSTTPVNLRGYFLRIGGSNV